MTEMNWIVAGGIERDSSTSLAPDEEVGDTDDLPAPVQEHSSFIFEGVRFTPKVVEFSDAFEGKQFVQKVKLQNMSKNPVLVKMGEPSSFIFHMNKHDRCVRLLPSGKCITRTITYAYHNNDLVQRSQIRIQINGRTIDYPIIVKRAVPVIEVKPPELDFKVINMGASAKTLKITLFNTGGRGTKFAIDLGRNELDLVVSPNRGTIRAKSHINVYVEMVGITEGEFYKEMWVTTTERPIRVPIVAEVMTPRLEVYHPNATGDFTLIDFPPTFIGTQRVDSFILRNFSADMTPFVTFAEINGELKSIQEAVKQESAFKMFKSSAEEGRLEPFESRIVSVVFRPLREITAQGWHHQMEKNIRPQEYLVFYRINRVHCVERKELKKAEGELRADSTGATRRDADKYAGSSSLAMPVYSTSFTDGLPNQTEADEKWFFIGQSTQFETKDVVRLCLHGESVEPELTLEPDALYFGETTVGETKTKVVKLTNASIITMMFKVCKLVNLKTEPSKGWLRPNEAIEASFVHCPSYAGNFKKNVQIEVFAKSAVLFDGDQGLVSLKFFSLPISGSDQMEKKTVKPNIYPGISPVITNEVGILSDMVTYGSSYPKPYSAVLGALKGKTKPKWMTQERNKVKNVKNAVIAFPNDRLGFTSAYDPKVYRSIFTGQVRYAPPPDEDYTFTKEQFEKRDENQQIWLNYLRDLSELRKMKQAESLRTMKALDYETSCGQALEMSYSDAMEFVENEHLKAFKCSLQKDYTVPKRVLIPLSPLFLCNIKVEPKLIDFSMVAPNSPAYKTLKLHNTNSFPVSIRFIPGKSGVTLPFGDTRVVPPLTKKMLQIVFKTKDFGRYNGFLDYVINGSHQFKITVSANVVPKTLIIPENEYILDFGNFPASSAFQPNSRSITLINPLQSPIKFHWEIQGDSPFEIEPMQGEVPPMVCLKNQVQFIMDPDKSFFSEANLISESGAILPIKLSYRKPRSSVFFTSNKIEVPEVSLNMIQKIKATVRNMCYYEVAFEVIDKTPMPGVKVYPSQGVIKPRSTFNLELTLQIPIIIRYQFEVKLRIQHACIITLKVTGSVIYPNIRITPNEVNMRRISAQSFDVAGMCVENLGSTTALVIIDFKDYPEYTVSKKKERPLVPVSQERFLLGPGKSAKFFLHFEPTDVARYQFYLPVIINGILGPPMMQDSLSEFASFYLEDFEESLSSYGEITRTADLKCKIPCTCINCTVGSHLLRFSSLDVEFRFSPDYFFEEEEVEVANLHVSHLTLCIRLDDVNSKSSPFSLTVTGCNAVEYHQKSVKITLKAKEVAILKMKFNPLKAGLYVADLPIFLRHYKEGFVYNFIRLRGELKKAVLSTETTEIHFPPVPLGIGTEIIIQIYAERYGFPDIISCSVWEVSEYGRLISDSLNINWLEEPKITGENEIQSFAVQIYFSSNYPVSLRTFVIFTDSRGEYLPVLVTAISDNSSVTTHLFLSTRSNKYKFIHDKPLETEDENPLNYSTRKPLTKRPSKLSNIFKKPADSKKGRVRSFMSSRTDYEFAAPFFGALKLESGPKLGIQMTKSMTRITQLNFVSIQKPYDYKKKESNFGGFNSLSALSHSDVFNNIGNTSSIRTPKGISESSPFYEISYPNFPNNDINTSYEQYLIQTQHYLEIWVYEVVLHCEEYMSIPHSFQMTSFRDRPLNKRSKTGNENADRRKSIIDVLEVFVGPKIRIFFPDKQLPPKDSSARLEYLYSVFYSLLHFLHVQGCFLPHVRPENLFSYEDYVNFVTALPQCETLKCGAGFPILNPFRKVSSSIGSSGSKFENKDDIGMDFSLGTLNETLNKPAMDDAYDDELLEIKEKRFVEIDETSSLPRSFTTGKKYPSGEYESFKEFVYRREPMDEKAHHLRSTQAWIDVIVQIFRMLSLPKIVIRKNTNRHSGELDESFSTEVINTRSVSAQNFFGHRGDSMQVVDNYESNVYSVQERILLAWLVHHYEMQRTVLWPGNSQSDVHSTPPPRQVDSFRTDLIDSLVLMAVTASHCPYLISKYFVDVFSKPETPEQICHNAIQLTNAWKEVNIGLSVEPVDIISGNQVFMVIVVAHLYETLPLLCPRSIIRFWAPLTEEMSRSIELTNKSNNKVTYEAKFIGGQDGCFRLLSHPIISIRGSKKTEIKIVFRARRIQKVGVTLLLCGASVSPHFAKTLVFELEGEPSELSESARIKLQGAMYKSMCFDLAVRPPYSEEANYEISYSSQSPQDSDHRLASMKPWKEIWNKKSARRLFLNQSELYFDGKSPAVLNMTIACLTTDVRSFWLLFRSEEVGDFIIKIEITSKLKHSICGPITVLLPETWSPISECTCIDVERNLRIGTKSSSVCPLLSYVEVPARNSFLWDTMFVMFQKSLDSKEKTFWKKHFETNIGINLIKWLLQQDELPEVVDEFLPCLDTCVQYSLKLDSQTEKYIRIIPTLEISDIRSREPVTLPIHISNKTPDNLKMTLTMLSSGKKEIRVVKYILKRSTELSRQSKTTNDSREH